MLVSNPTMSSARIWWR